MSKRQVSIVVVLMATLLGLAGTVQAQLSGHNSRGDFGLQSGTMPPPGWYLVAPMYYRYSADEFRDRNGDRFTALDGGGSVEATAWVASVTWVSDFIAGIGLVAPTGEYEPGGSNNRGLGMWSYELSAGHEKDPDRIPQPALLVGNRRPYLVAG